MKRLRNFLRAVFAGDRLKIFSEDLFLESTCACVLGPWPRAFLSLASRGSVHGRVVLGLGLEPCVLEYTSDSVTPRKYY